MPAALRTITLIATLFALPHLSAQTPAVEGVNCLEHHDQGMVEVSWTNAGVYDEIQVNGPGNGPTTILPGTAESTTIPLPVHPSELTVTVIPRVNGVGGWARSCLALPAPHPEISFHASNATGNPLQTVTTTLRIENSHEPLNSFVFSICHDPSVLTPQLVEPTAITNVVNDGGFPDWHSVELEATPCGGGGPIGVTIATIVSIWSTHQLPVGNYDLFDVTYSVETDQPTVSELSFCETDCPTVINRVARANPNTTVFPSMIGSTISIVPVTYIRGDTNEDGSVTTADAIQLLAEIFGLQPTGECPAIGDVDRSGTRDLADPVSLLSYLFLGGGAPAAPFPGCSQDPIGPLLECTANASCP